MLPDNVAIKFGAYSLYCRQLLDQLPALKQAVFGEAEVDDAAEISWDKCLDLFNRRLAEFFESKDYDSTIEAAEKLGQLLSGSVDLLVDKRHDVVKTFENVIANALAQSSSWDFETDVKRYHQQGRELAQKFFQHSSLDDIQQKLHKSAELELEFGRSGSSRSRTNVDLTLGYRVAPAATFRGKLAGEGERIVFRVSYDNDFSLYLLYPFLFLHEYTAHIFANDLKNAVFNDGWMLYAASEFLISDWRDNDRHALTEAQVYVFHETFSGRLRNHPRRGYGLAYRLGPWMNKNSQAMTFQSMTNELVAFVPTGDEKNSWPSKFINALENGFEGSRQTLIAKLRTATSLRMLFKSLTK